METKTGKSMSGNFIIKVKRIAKEHVISFADALACEKFVHESAKIQSDIAYTKKQSEFLKQFEGIFSSDRVKDMLGLNDMAFADKDLYAMPLKTKKAKAVKRTTKK